mmetsp:Transcript_36621/g.68245  ORF Transcript_36621/g.68245 Transcript_36621/m.68245 type:complete len:756 (+) Transcript_36621:83-2350(+)
MCDCMNVWTHAGRALSRPLLWSRQLGVVALLGIAALPGVQGTILEPCPVDPGAHLELGELELVPEVPSAGGHLTVRVRGEVTGSNGSSLNLDDLDIEVLIFYCRRVDDCLEIHTTGVSGRVCEIAKLEECSERSVGEVLQVNTSWDLPFIVIRGFYSVKMSINDRVRRRTVSCYYSKVILGAEKNINKFYDYRDAIVAFAVAASSSRALGKVFPVFSYGFLPQITGFLMIGVIVGPYVTNLVSRYNIFLLGNLINRLSLAFIAGAAGAEIFMPDLYSLLGPMLLQVALITVFTLLLCSGGFLLVASSGLVAVQVITSQPTFVAKFSIALLTAALMTARSPASAIAVIAELQCSNMRICKVILGITVLGDVVVLILFALCTNFARSSIEGGAFGPGVLLSVSLELILSGILGFLAGQALRLVLPSRDPDIVSISQTPVSGHISHVFIAGTEFHNWFLGIFRGAVLIAILFATYMIADTAEEWSHKAFRLEPLLACTLASCLCGHDRNRRAALEEAISNWTPIVLLPFFTLAGASLQLHSMSKVVPAACVLVVLRMLSIAIGSLMSGLISVRLYPELDISSTTVNCTWMTLLAQAGVTLGLVLEVQHTFPGWGHELATLVIGVVVLNQLIGPIMCRIGLRWIVEADANYEATPQSFVEFAETGTLQKGDTIELMHTTSCPSVDGRKMMTPSASSDPGFVRWDSNSSLTQDIAHSRSAAVIAMATPPDPDQPNYRSKVRTITRNKDLYGSAVYGALLD